MLRVKSPQDFWAGILFLVVGCLAAWYGRQYNFGTATKMGPGYLPTVLSWGLAGLGAFLALRAFAIEGATIEPGVWRPQVLILLAIAMFGLLIERFGLAPTILVVTILASLASTQMRWREVVPLAIGLAVLCVLLFVRLLGQPLTIWDWGF